MIHGVVFDIGGVLAYDIIEYLFAPENWSEDIYKLDPELLAGTSRKLWEKYAHTRKDFEDTWHEVEQAYWNDFKEETKVEIPNETLVNLSVKFIHPVQHMTIVLDWLKDMHFDLLICSNNTEFFYQRQKQVVPFEKYFEKRKIILSNHYGVPKHEETFTMFKAVEQQMDYPKEDYLFIDDKPKNIKAALQFGLTPLLFPKAADYGHLYVREIISKINNIN